MSSASFTAPDAEQLPAAPTAQHKRNMATLTKVEGFLKVAGTPYVVLSVDGPVDIERLVAGLGMTNADTAQGLLGATYDEQTLLQHVTTPQDEGFVTTLPAPRTGADESMEDDPEDEVDLSPDQVILAYLRAHGASDSKTIARETGVTGTTLGATLVQLMNENRVAKNGLAYAAVGHTG